ncbi:hypothetical protein KIW84_025346 [Lathyrus oleraceus]|uniref:Uncharacterized protein n=1 Tax=Pisum sativum TaxID=3888 RepID=A0A9D4YI41_PEA|nr:hypothetical protein KIW84_025346 [Pisum sativum]
MVSFEDRAPNVKANMLPAHGNALVNMVDGSPGNFKVFDARRIRRSLVEMPRTLCLINDCEHDHDGCVICSVNPGGCMIVKRDIQKLMDENFDNSNNNNVNKSVSPLVRRLAGPVPYSSDKVVSYQYNAIMIENIQKVPLPVADSVVNIADIAKVTCIGRVFSPVFPKVVEDVSIGKKAEITTVNPISTPMCQSGESSKLKANYDDEVIEMAGRGRDDAAIAEALGMLVGVLGGNPNVVGLGAARQLSEFQKNNPLMFKGAYDPDGAQKWLKEIERIF